ncbi:MAG: C25 family cysteine peptidase [Candidatus Thermoplasmatota archaeon]|nr:C25 family cysteine peptidase [Candidatus Thermoplasmatota archaeon]
MKNILATLLSIMLIGASLFSGCLSEQNPANEGANSFSMAEALALCAESKFKPVEDAVIVPDTDPFYALLGASIAARYAGLASETKPMLVVGSDGTASSFLERYAPASVLSLGKAAIEGITAIPVHGCNPTSCSINLMAQCWEKAPGVMLIPHTKQGYEISVNAAPLASYLGIPILVIDEEIANGSSECEDALWGNIESTLDSIGAKYAIAIGADGERFAEQLKLPALKIENSFDATCAVAEAVKGFFGKLDYIAIANPTDSSYPSVLNKTSSLQNGHIENVEAIVGGEKVDISGSPSQSFKIGVPSGIVRLQVYATITNFAVPVKLATEPAGIVPIIYATLYDSKGAYAGFSTSMAYDGKSAYIDTLIVNNSGEYRLDVGMYYGSKGVEVIATPYMAGASYASADISVNATAEMLDSTSIPIVPRLSMVAPYLAAARKGIVIASPDFNFNDGGYTAAAEGSCTGPGYDVKLHQYNNMKFNQNLEYISSVFDALKNQSLLDGYLAGPAYFAIVGDTNMVPMYYYPADSEPWPEDGVGLPSDLPYSTLDANATEVKLSIGRPIGWSAEDASALIARSLFYSRYMGAPSTASWHSNFMFLCGGGGGEFGSLFHQIPYGATAAQYGFVPQYYIDAASGRQATETVEAYANSNYFEGIAHGNWYWYVTDLYGPDVYSTSVSVSKVRGWEMQPMVFMTSMCHTGRIDGIPATEALSQAFVHAGVNAYLGATRATGSESSTAIMEDALILNNMTIGEAFRELKRVEQAPPSFYIRTLYAEPNWNPYEPNNG